MEEAGVPQDLIDMHMDLCRNLCRYLKIGGTYGAIVQQANGTPQGISMSLIIANLYVTTLFRYLEDKFPGIALGAFVDDRNLRHEDVEVLKGAIDAVSMFDEAAGHRTNILKSILFTTDPETRRKLREEKKEKESAGEQAPAVELDGVMVGHTITTRRSQRATTSKVSDRVETFTARAARVASSRQAYDKKVRLMSTAVIPTIATSCSWELPTKRGAASMQSAAVTAVWGHTRKQRCTEAVLSVVHDPIKLDPVAAMVFKRLADARRLMKRKCECENMAIHTNCIAGDSDQNLPILGPVRGLRHAARYLGGILSIHDGALAILFGDGTVPISLTKGDDRCWKAQVRDALRRTTANSLRDRAGGTAEGEREDEEEMGRRARKRKDMEGIVDGIDHYATGSLLSNRGPRLTSLLRGEDEAHDGVNFKNDPLWKQRLMAVITGANRSHERLHKANLVDRPDCPLCGHAKCTIEHVHWDCPHFRDERQRYLDAFEKYKRKWAEKPERVQAIDEVMKKPCFRNCGIVPEDPWFHRDRRGQYIRGCFEVTHQVHRDLLTENQRGGEVWENQRVLAFTDGAAMNPRDARRSRAGWAVYYGPDHQWNEKQPLHGDFQCSYRAELAAVTHVIATAQIPTAIVSDCQAVVDAVAEIIDGGSGTDLDCDADLWNIIRARVREAPDGFFDIAWIPSHLTDEQIERAEESGGYTRAHFEANRAADEMAKQAASMHTIDEAKWAQADDREVLANLAQRMYVKMWSMYRDACGEGDAHEEEDAEQDDDEVGEHDFERNDLMDLPEDANMHTIANALQEQGSNYAWEVKEEECRHTIHIPDTPVEINWGERSTTNIPGRGKVNTSADFPTYVGEAVRWWASRLRWTSAYEGAGDERNAGDVCVTFAECVVDFETSTGLELKNAADQLIGWGEKAARLRNIWKKIASVHTVMDGGDVSTFGDAYKPRNDVPSLVPLGAPRLPGVLRKPRWVMSTTPKIVAANVWRALGSSTDRRTMNGRTFMRGWSISHSGFVLEHPWRSEQEKEYNELIDKRVTREQSRLAVLTDDQWQALAEPRREQASKRRRNIREELNRARRAMQGDGTPSTPEPQREGERIQRGLGSSRDHAGASHDARSDASARNDGQPLQPSAAALRLAALRQRVRLRLEHSQDAVEHSTTFSQAVAQAPAVDYCAECQIQHTFGLYRVPKRSSWRRHGPGTSLCRSCFEAAEFSRYQTGS